MDVNSEEYHLKEQCGPSLFLVDLTRLRVQRSNYPTHQTERTSCNTHY